jgi:hypothetical protein
MRRRGRPAGGPIPALPASSAILRSSLLDIALPVNSERVTDISLRRAHLCNETLLHKTCREFRRRYRRIPALCLCPLSSRPNPCPDKPSWHQSIGLYLHRLQSTQINMRSRSTLPYASSHPVGPGYIFPQSVDTMHCPDKILQNLSTRQTRLSKAYEKFFEVR